MMWPDWHRKRMVFYLSYADPIRPREWLATPWVCCVSGTRKFWVSYSIGPFPRRTSKDTTSGIAGLMDGNPRRPDGGKHDLKTPFQMPPLARFSCKQSSDEC